MKNEYAGKWMAVGAGEARLDNRRFRTFCPEHADDACGSGAPPRTSAWTCGDLYDYLVDIQAFDLAKAQHAGSGWLLMERAADAVARAVPGIVYDAPSYEPVTAELVAKMHRDGPRRRRA
jgi:hypothetical protein